MKQYTENQYDDDLTVGTDDYDDSYYTGSVDLFEFASDEESPISRLKSLILSIDWEITDEVLMQFNEELVDLRDIWAGEKINLVYIQALEKISKYIYQKKAESHPSAIKLLLTLYHNLEKIVSSEELTEGEKKEILLEDVKRFESLKRHISKPHPVVEEAAPIEPPPSEPEPETVGDESDLINLKAIVLGIDWEITDQDLNELRQEVGRLEGRFAESKPKLILLQGIGTLGAYIKLKKSDSHADAFKILHLFYDSLEKIVTRPMSFEEEKGILYPAVEKFNSFKAMLGPSISSDRDGQEEPGEKAGVPTDSSAVMPAFADYSEGEVRGFQAEEEAKTLDTENTGNIDSHVESFFNGSAFFDDESPASSEDFSSEELQKQALEGVNVEIDDEEEGEELALESGDIGPALGDVDGDEDGIEPPADPHDLQFSDDLDVLADDESPIGGSAEADESNEGVDFSKLDRDTVLQGVDVETEADDDSDEDALPMMGDELAPALAENDEVSLYNAEIVEDPDVLENVGAGIVDSIGGFFDEEIKSHTLVASESAGDEEPDAESEAVAALAEAEDLGIFSASDSPADLPGNEIAALDDELLSIEEEELESPKDEQEPELAEDVEDTKLEADVGEVEVPADDSHDEAVPLTPAVEDVGDEESIAFMSELEQEESLDSLFDEGEFEQEVDDALDQPGQLFSDEVQESELSDEPVASIAERIAEDTDDSESIDDKLDSFFDMDEESDPGDEEIEDEADALHLTPPVELSEDQVAEEDEVEEEVVFELVEDLEDIAETEVEPVSEDGLLAVAATGAGAEDVDEEISASSFVTEEVFDDASHTDFEDEVGEEIVEGFAEEFAPILEGEKFEDAYGALQTCIDSLGIELDDKIILGLWGEIDHLSKLLTDKPLEQTFLQLLSTLTRHIDQNRYDSSSEAFTLMKSVSGTLTELKMDDLHGNQEKLLNETQKVLAWQEDVLTQLHARREAELLISDNLSVEDDVDTDPNSTVSTEFNQQPDQEISPEQKGTEIQKDDISSLRRTLQDEIEELRKELKGDSP